MSAYCFEALFLTTPNNSGGAQSQRRSEALKESRLTQAFKIHLAMTSPQSKNGAETDSFR